MTNFEISIRVFLQIAVILAACRAVGWLVRPLGQPQVVAEMITGVLLGPSLFGWLAPQAQAWLFPKPTLVVIYALAQIGLVLYMFLVGLEFDIGLLRARAKTAVWVSWAGILVPFGLGAWLALWLRHRVPLFTEGVERGEAMLFMGAAMSITAFPMLARIIYERGLAGTSLGTLALTAGSLDDAAAWCILAAVLASFTGDMSIAWLAIGGGALFAALTLTLGRRFLAYWIERLDRQAQRLLLPFVLSVLAVAAWLTDTIGIYAVFGAVVVGAAMPRGVVQKRLEAELAPLTTNLLLPMFFIFSGLNTRIGLIGSWNLLGVALLVLAAASLGKFGACSLAARLGGEPWRQAAAIGALMNARGLMELIILNIGLERNVITPTLFAIMVLMAIVTTLLAVPVFNAVIGAGGRDMPAEVHG
jgi:Kef-type K+ transport system membrane component KefB